MMKIWSIIFTSLNVGHYFENIKIIILNTQYSLSADRLNKVILLLFSLFATLLIFAIKIFYSNTLKYLTCANKLLL